MYEAFHLADSIHRFLNGSPSFIASSTDRLTDGGARFHITVTDTAGNVAEIEWDSVSQRWTWEDGCALAVLVERIRPLSDIAEAIGRAVDWLDSQRDHLISVNQFIEETGFAAAATRFMVRTSRPRRWQQPS